MNTTNETTEYELVCGLEVHLELHTKSKMFCGCRNAPFGAPRPNCYVCPVCLGLPGALPVPNKRAIESTILLGLALGCSINRLSKFDRKHYRYPDLPKGYQITQYEKPFCYGSALLTTGGPVRIRRIHLEEDTGKLVHRTDWSTMSNKTYSLIDFNRSGVPLVELVTEPDIRSPAQAKEFGKNLRSIIRYLGISGADLERGEMRLEASVSLRRTGESALPPYKVELKNINSFGFLEKAISFEMKRQRALVAQGVVPMQETRGWDEDRGETVPQRRKEEARDYRYFPDPDIPPIELSESLIEAFRASIPELPAAKARRWKETYGIEERYAAALVEEREETDRWEDMFLALLWDGVPVGEFVKDTCNKRTAFTPATPPAEVASHYRAKRAVEMPAKESILCAIDGALRDEPKAVADYRVSGNPRVFGFLMGAVLKRLGATSGGEEVKKLLAERLH